MFKVDTRNFKESEFVCSCGKCEYSKSAGMDERLLMLLEYARLLGKGLHESAYIVIESGRRCPEHNRKVKGAANSKHLHGLAGDAHFYYKTADNKRRKFSDCDLACVYKKLADTFPGKYGIALYKRSGFIHIDVDKRCWREIRNG